MAERFQYKVLVPVVVALCVVLTVVGFLRGWLGRTRSVGGSQSPTGENTVVHDDARGAIAAVAQHLALSQPLSPTAPQHQRDEEDEFSSQLSQTKTASREGAQERKQAGRAARATSPFVEQKLVVDDLAVKETQRGPVATFRFKSATSDPTGPVTIVAFLPPGSEAQILDLSPRAGSVFSEIDKRVSDNGWFAAFRGVPQAMTDFSFQLSVSEPAVATIKGNLGIEPFQIDLGSLK